VEKLTPRDEQFNIHATCDAFVKANNDLLSFPLKLAVIRQPDAKQLTFIAHACPQKLKEAPA
jgi:hypothetical protein